jgi:hypothetical protein
MWPPCSGVRGRNGVTGGGLRMAGRTHVRHEGAVKQAKSGHDRFGDGGQVIDEFQTVQVRGQDAGTGAVAAVNDRVTKQQIAQDSVSARVGQNPAQHETLPPRTHTMS